MNDELRKLLEEAKGKTLTAEQQEEQLVLMAAANGNLSDQRITVATVEAARTILVAAGETEKAA